jgi:hypothetical protein
MSALLAGLLAGALKAAGALAATAVAYATAKAGSALAEHIKANADNVVVKSAMEIVTLAVQGAVQSTETDRVINYPMQLDELDIAHLNGKTVDKVLSCLSSDVLNVVSDKSGGSTRAFVSAMVDEAVACRDSRFKCKRNCEGPGQDTKPDPAKASR